MTSGGFSGFQPALLSRRDSSFKLRQSVEKKKSEPVKREGKESINGETEKQLPTPHTDDPSSATL